MKPILCQISLLILASGVGLSQTAGEHPSFEVASVKPTGERGSAGGPVVRSGCFGGPGSSDPGRLTCNAVSLARFVTMAYRLQPYQFNFPDWMNQTFYNIAATIPTGSTTEQVRLMEQNLLAERFKMAAHFEKKEMPAYELKVGKDGPKCKETAPDPLPADGIVKGDYQQIGGRVSHKAKQTMEELAFYLTIRLGRPVFDATGLTGKYEIALDFVQEAAARGGRFAAASSDGGAAAAAADPDGGPTLINAIQTQLGLKLETKKHLIDVLVIDHAEKVPVEN
jgi:uncharacterized protein (TIGR03435 family)